MVKECLRGDCFFILVTLGFFRCFMDDKLTFQLRLPEKMIEQTCEQQLTTHRPCMHTHIHTVHIYAQAPQMIVGMFGQHRGASALTRRGGFQKSLMGCWSVETLGNAS